MKSNRSPVVRADPDRHPLIGRDGLSAPVAILPDALTVPELNRGVSWQATVMNPESNHLATNFSVHAYEVGFHRRAADGIGAIP
jgi:hypothetical protein